MDGVNYNANWEEVGREKRNKIILKKIQQDKWIIEGNYTATFQERAQRSDLQKRLDYSSFSILKGTFGRYIKNFNKEKPEIPGCKETMDTNFFLYVITYRKEARKKLMEKIKEVPKEKVIVFYKRKELNLWLDEIKKHYHYN